MILIPISCEKVHPDKTYTRSIVKIFRMISKNIREVKKAQKKNIQPHKRERGREREPKVYMI